MRGTWFKQKQLVWEKEVLIGLLQEYRGNIWHIANAIDERRSRLYRMLHRHGLNPSDYRCPSTVTADTLPQS